MTIYNLTQALIRYKRFIFLSLGVLMLAVLVLTFDIADGGIRWRGGLKFESGIQISVVSPGVSTLSEASPGLSLIEAANTYADLLSTGEAAEAIGEMTGYEVDKPISASVGKNPLISMTIVGPSSEFSRAAALNSFVWLADKIQQPLDAQPPIQLPEQSADVSLIGQFQSTTGIDVSEELSSVREDLFVLVNTGQSTELAVPVAGRAGTLTTSSSTLESGGSVVMRLEGVGGEVLDVVRLAPDPLPSSAPAYPRLVITLGPDSVRTDENEEGEKVWVLDNRQIIADWVPGTVSATPVDADFELVQIALLTDVPSAIQIGGRRGPLIGFSVLVVGLIVILAGVIVADTWRIDRERQIGLNTTERTPMPVSEVSVDVTTVSTPIAEPETVPPSATEPDKNRK